jgi:hypothetical protein
VAEARPPTRAALEQALEELGADVDRARSHGVGAVVYVVFAGHGNVRDGQGYIALEDARLTGAWLEQHVVERLGAARVHFIIDACQSFFLAYARGPGGEHRLARGFSQVGPLAERDDVGLLLSASGSMESHEWAALQAGVFSHEVRSGLYGAADANEDGRITYKEIAAFVENANATIANEKFRPALLARPPRAGSLLVDLRGSLDRRVEVGGRVHGHFYVEDTRGVRLVDFHNSRSQRVRLARPAALGRLFVRQVETGREYLVPATATVVNLDKKKPRKARAQTRGAAHHAFSKLFERPFDVERVEEYELVDLRIGEASNSGFWTTAIGWVGLGLGAALAGSAIAVTASNRRLRGSLPVGASQAETDNLNSRIDARNNAAIALYAAGAAAALTGILLLAWPDDEAATTMTVAPAPGGVALRTSF